MRENFELESLERFWVAIGLVFCRLEKGDPPFWELQC